MSDIQDLIEDYAAGVEYTAHVAKFLQLERWTGDDLSCCSGCSRNGDRPELFCPREA